MTVGPIVTQDWQLEHLGDPSVRVVDCRYELADPAAGRRLYEAGHIAGAGFLALETDLSGAHGEGRHPLPSARAFAAAARRVGIGSGTFVVAYDQDMAGSAARLWWLLRHFGHDAVAVLEGGFRQWTGPVRAGRERSQAGDFSARPRTGDLVHSADVRAGLGSPGRLLVDARAQERFRGDVEPIDPVAGHIPGARNLPLGDAFPPPQELVAAKEDLVVYCGSGVTACGVLLALADAGRTDAKLYPGSWSGWLEAGGPVETGEAR